VPKFPDISEWYTGATALQEEVAWLLRPQYHQRDAEFIIPRLGTHQIKTVVECGCGSGILASILPESIKYLGIDKNNFFLEKARRRNGEKNEGRLFACWDMRNIALPEPRDLVLCFAVFKHFALDEFEALVAKVLSLGRFGAIQMQVSDHDFDNGEKYHHIYVTEDRFFDAVKAAGHEIIDTVVQWEFAIDSGEPCKTIALWTQKQGEPPKNKQEKEAPWTVGDPPPPPELPVRLLKEPVTCKKHPSSAIQWFGPIARCLTCGEAVEHPEAPKRSQYLAVDGRLVDDLENYVLRWTHEGGITIPVLYFHGKRVTAAWTMGLDIRMPRDPHGENANTAETPCTKPSTD
jgi:hypothetical protein